jgi:hypothetical protein
MMIDTIYALLGVFLAGNVLQAVFRVDAKREEGIFFKPHDLDYLDFRHSVYVTLFWASIITSSLYYYYHPLPYYLNFKAKYSTFAYHTIVIMFSMYVGASFNYYFYKIFFRD